MSASRPIPTEGRYELQPADRVRFELRRVGLFDWILWPVMGLLSIWLGVRAAFPRGLPSLLIGLLFVTIPVLVPWLHGRSVARLPADQRRLRVAFSEEGVVLTDEAGNVTRCGWAAYSARRESTDAISLELKTTGQLHIFPRRAWRTPAEFATARALVASHVEPTRDVRASRVALLTAAVLFGSYALQFCGR